MRKNITHITGVREGDYVVFGKNCSVANHEGPVSNYKRGQVKKVLDIDVSKNLIYFSSIQCVNFSDCQLTGFEDTIDAHDYAEYLITGKSADSESVRLKTGTTSCKPSPDYKYEIGDSYSITILGFNIKIIYEEKRIRVTTGMVDRVWSFILGSSERIYNWDSRRADALRLLLHRSIVGSPPIYNSREEVDVVFDFMIRNLKTARNMFGEHTKQAPPPPPKPKYVRRWKFQDKVQFDLGTHILTYRVEQNFIAGQGCQNDRILKDLGISKTWLASYWYSSTSCGGMGEGGFPESRTEEQLDKVIEFLLRKAIAYKEEVTSAKKEASKPSLDESLGSRVEEITAKKESTPAWATVTKTKSSSKSRFAVSPEKMSTLKVKRLTK
jgi:hypothetical protein